jgi:hypothetical protein
MTYRAMGRSFPLYFWRIGYPTLARFTIHGLYSRENDTHRGGVDLTDKKRLNWHRSLFAGPNETIELCLSLAICRAVS